MKDITIIGVDPGKSGGIAFITADRRVHVHPIPLVGNEIDLKAIVDQIEYYIGEYGVNYTQDSVAAYIEKVGAMPGQGVTSMFTFGFGTGAIHGILAGLSIPRYLVAPQAWKKDVLEGLDWKHNKAIAVEYCTRAYPKVSFLATERSKKPHSGMADALCIAEYGFKRMRNDL